MQNLALIVVDAQHVVLDFGWHLDQLVEENAYEHGARFTQLVRETLNFILHIVPVETDHLEFRGARLQLVHQSLLHEMDSSYELRDFLVEQQSHLLFEEGLERLLRCFLLLETLLKVEREQQTMPYLLP